MQLFIDYRGRQMSERSHKSGQYHAIGSRSALRLDAQSVTKLITAATFQIYLGLAFARSKFPRPVNGHQLAGNTNACWKLISSPPCLFQSAYWRHFCASRAGRLMLPRRLTLSITPVKVMKRSFLLYAMHRPSFMAARFPLPSPETSAIIFSP